MCSFDEHPDEFWAENILSACGSSLFSNLRELQTNDILKKNDEKDFSSVSYSLCSRIISFELILSCFFFIIIHILY